MPYIMQSQRDVLDTTINQLAEDIVRLAGNDEKAFAGILNYTCTRLALEIIPERRYWAIALVTGVFKNIADEFYRRYAAPYEEEQIVKNGDVYDDPA